MVNFAKLSIGSAVLAAQLALGAPGAKRDSAVGGEVAVSAPDGIPITDTKELASQSLAEASSSTAYNNGGYTTTAAMMDTTSVAYQQSSSDNMYTNAYQTTTMNTWDSMSTSVAYDTSSAEYTSSSSVMYDTTSTSSAAYTMATYGSGSSNWGNSGYNDCVQQCIASFGAPMATYTPPSSTDNSGSSGSGATHTVIVAPSQGVLRYVPFAVNASVGDTIKFMWNANMHTVTKSSQLELCNKTSDAPFTSGVQNKSFVFTQQVNSTDPVFFYCGVPTHCQKGMFGIVNPPNADVSSSMSVNSMMPMLINNSSEVSMWNTYTQNMTQGNPTAANWGGSIDMSNMPDWAPNVMAENVMYTRSFLAANPDVIKSDGSVDLGASSSPFMIPNDLNAVMASSSSASGAAAGPTSPAGNAGSGAGSSAAPSSSPAASGARGLASSTALAVAVAFGAAFFAL